MTEERYTLEQLIDELNKPEPWSKKIRYFPARTKHRIQQALLELKWAWQRATRKYDESMVWSFSYWMSEVMPKILQELIDMDNIGISMAFFPEHVLSRPDGHISDDEHDYAYNLMMDTFKAMRDGFKASRALLDYEWKDEEHLHALQEREQEALELFAKYYHSIGD